MRFAITLLTVICIASVIGTVLRQHEPDHILLEAAWADAAETLLDLKRLSDALEPILLVFMGALVLLLALGIFMPMWSMGSAMGR